MVVEDDRVVARDIQQQLKRMGHQVVGTAARGEDAVSLALNNDPDLVLMDIRLEGEIDGIDAAQQIRERCGSPVVFLTAYTDDETVGRASRAEPFGYLLKPFDESQLRTTIEMALYKHAAEQKLRESERRYATTLSSIGDAVIATDKLARITFINPAAQALTGWRQEEAVGIPIQTVFRIVNEETRETVEDPAAKALQLGRAVGLAERTVLLTRDGRELPVDDCGSPITDDRGEITGAVLVFRDITQRNQVQESLRASQEALMRASRLTSLGELTVSIAHEVNQPLMAVVTNAGTCLQWLTEERLNIPEARRAAERIIRDGHRAGDVVASIRSLAKKGQPSLASMDLNAALLDVLALVRGELRRNGVSTETELSADAGPVMGDRVQLQQVALNLIMNGVDSMREAASPQRLLRVTTRREDDRRVMVTFSDTGTGLHPAVAGRIFEPFFTTKSEGIGIGLSICRSIVEAHNGRISAASNQPRGSVFSFTVPIASDEGAHRGSY
jgi:PAS domain S-box-containing protein